jgi:hypothetical protein
LHGCSTSFQAVSFFVELRDLDGQIKSWWVLTSVAISQPREVEVSGVARHSPSS